MRWKVMNDPIRALTFQKPRQRFLETLMSYLKVRNYVVWYVHGGLCVLRQVVNMG